MFMYTYIYIYIYVYIQVNVYIYFDADDLALKEAVAAGCGAPCPGGPWRHVGNLLGSSHGAGAAVNGLTYGKFDGKP